MYQDEIRMETIALRKYAEETCKKAEELELYKKWGILSKSMYDNMYDELEARTMMVAARTDALFERLRKWNDSLDD